MSALNNWKTTTGKTGKQNHWKINPFKRPLKKTVTLESRLSFIMESTITFRAKQKHSDIRTVSSYTSCCSLNRKKKQRGEVLSKMWKGEQISKTPYLKAFFFKSSFTRDPTNVQINKGTNNTVSSRTPSAQTLLSRPIDSQHLGIFGPLSKS